eukprot:m.63788 g.63788  ORF g.63788 m.63788 type:complete len:1163 (+) comp19490_c1_seq2:783-4271(+)
MNSPPAARFTQTRTLTAPLVFSYSSSNSTSRSLSSSISRRHSFEDRLHSLHSTSSISAGGLSTNSLFGVVFDQVRRLLDDLDSILYCYKFSSLRDFAASYPLFATKAFSRRYQFLHFYVNTLNQLFELSIDAFLWFRLPIFGSLSHQALWTARTLQERQAATKACYLQVSNFLQTIGLKKIEARMHLLMDPLTKIVWDPFLNDQALFAATGLPSLHPFLVHLCWLPMTIASACLQHTLSLCTPNVQSVSLKSTKFFVERLQATLEVAVRAKAFFGSTIENLSRSHDLEVKLSYAKRHFHQTLQQTFNEHLHLTGIAFDQLLQETPAAALSDTLIDLFEEKYPFAKQVARHLGHQGAVVSSLCRIAGQVLSKTIEWLSPEIDYQSWELTSERLQGTRRCISEAFSRALKILRFTKTLQRDVECASIFSFPAPLSTLLPNLMPRHTLITSRKSSSLIPNKLVFVPTCALRNNPHFQDQILMLLTESWASRQLDHQEHPDFYVLLVPLPQQAHVNLDTSSDTGDSLPASPLQRSHSWPRNMAVELWAGDVYELTNAPTFDEAIENNLVLICAHSSLLKRMRNRFLGSLKATKANLVALVTPHTCWRTSIAKSLRELVQHCIQIFGEKIADVLFGSASCLGLTEIPNNQLETAQWHAYHEAFLRMFNYCEEMCKLGGDPVATQSLLCRVARRWTEFYLATTHPSSGRIPRSAKQGMEFVLLVARKFVHQSFPKHDFGNFRTTVDACLSHLRSGSSERHSFSMSHCIACVPDEDDPLTFDDIEEKLAKGIAVSSFALREQGPTFRVGHPLSQAQPKHSLLTLFRPETPSRFDFVKKLGHGSSGQVYLGVDKKTRELVAVKQIGYKGRGRDPKAKQKLVSRAQREFKNFEKLKHPHVVEYLALDYGEDCHYLVLEYCPGQALRTEQSTPLPIDTVRKYTVQIALGLQYLHNNRIVHGDLKGANVLLDSQLNCKLGDMGSHSKLDYPPPQPEAEGSPHDISSSGTTTTNTSRSHSASGAGLLPDGGSENHSLELSKTFHGTEPFTAPEIFKGQEVTYACDVWSLGCVVVEMLTAKTPYTDIFPEFSHEAFLLAIFRGLRSGEVKRPTVPRSLIEEGKSFLNLCFEFDPTSRASAYGLLKHSFSTPYLGPSGLSGNLCPCLAHQQQQQQQ